MRNPFVLVAVGVVMYLVGYVLGSNNIDPASAIIATTGAALALCGLVWAVVVKVRGRGPATH